MQEAAKQLLLRRVVNRGKNTLPDVSGYLWCRTLVPRSAPIERICPRFAIYTGRIGKPTSVMQHRCGTRHRKAPRWDITKAYCDCGFAADVPLLCKPVPDPSTMAIARKFTFDYDVALGINNQTDIESDSNGEKSCVQSLVCRDIRLRSKRLCASG